MKKNIFIVLGLIICFIATPAIAGRWVAQTSSGSGSGSDKKCYLIKYSYPAITCDGYGQMANASSAYATGMGTVSGTTFTGQLKPPSKTFSSNYYVTCGGANKNECVNLCHRDAGCNALGKSNSGCTSTYYSYTACSSSYQPLDGYFAPLGLCASGGRVAPAYVNVTGMTIDSATPTDCNLVW